MEIRNETIDGKQISIIDNAFPEKFVKQFFDYANNLSYKRVEGSSDDDIYPIFSIDFERKGFFKTQLGRQIRKVAASCLPKQPNYMLWRAYINKMHYGDMEYPHRDCPIDKADMTILYYVNDFWDYRWGGETMFYEKNDTRIAILPKPGRVVVFPGSVEHIGSVPTRICNVSRMSLALKFSPAPTIDLSSVETRKKS